MIVKRDGKYYVLSKTGKKLSKGYASKSEARRRLAQIEHFKVHKEEKNAWDISHPFMNDLNED